MKNVISEIIKLELVKSILSEGRVEDAKAKYPSDIDVVDYFVSQDPSGNNKYLPWMMKIYKQDIPGNAPAELKSTGMQHITNLVRGFHQNVARIEVKDINQYKSLDQLHRVVNPLIIKAAEKADIKVKEESGVEKLYEDTDWLLMRPLTHEASCKYGANTQWCVASKDTSTHFNNYSKGFLVFLLHKKSNNKFAFFADIQSYGDGAFQNIEIYNPVDTDITDDGVTIKSFFDGLVSGKMQEYLDINDNYYEDDEEYELYKINPDGSRKLINAGLDESSLQDELVERILKTLLGKGSGRNTLEKHNKVLGYFNLILVPGTKDADGDIPWVINFIGKGKVQHIVDGGDDLKMFISEDGLDELLQDIMYDYSNLDLYNDIIVKNGLPYVVVGPGFEESTKSQKKSEFSDIMTEEQKNIILKKLIEAEKNTVALNKKRLDDTMTELTNSVSIDPKVINIVNTCTNLPGSKDAVTGRYTGVYSRCLEKAGFRPYDIPMLWVNPKSGRKLSRSIREIRQKLSTDNSVIAGLDMWAFVNNLFPKLLIKQKSDISVEEPEVKKEPKKISKKEPKKKR